MTASQLAMYARGSQCDANTGGTATWRQHARTQQHTHPATIMPCHGEQERPRDDRAELQALNAWLGGPKCHPHTLHSTSAAST